MDHQVAMEPVAIGRGLEDTLTILGAKARSKSVEVTLEVAPDLPCVEGIGGELNQVWVNLIDNAIDASPRGQVRVKATVERDTVAVRVSDDGPGIPPDVIGRIFDPFFTTKPVGVGVGLGLDMARRIVARHHGEIEVTTSDSGTEFRVTLPAVAAPPSA
jgi:signal transduction histidine kinase